MLDPREPAALRGRTDPVLSMTVGALAVIAAALLVAAVLATYTYSTPDVELPLIIAIALCFVVVLGVNLVRLALRHLRTGQPG
jgi:branched-subunit amino acid ABC-type transport system permease component